LQSQPQDDRADLCQGGVLEVDGTTSCSPVFTYMGEEIDANFSLLPVSLNNVAVQNYVGQNGVNDFAKLNPTIFSNLGLAAVDRTTTGQPYYLSTRVSNAGMPPVACDTTPCFSTSGANITVPFMLSRKSQPPACTNPGSDGTCPDGDYTAVDFGIALLDADGAPVDAAGTSGTGTCNNGSVTACYDMDADATAGNDHALVGSTAFRYGRMNIANAFGSEQLPLPIPLTAQYWDGSSYVTNVDDDLTSLLASNIVLGTYRRKGADTWTTSVSAVSDTGAGTWQAMLAIPVGTITGTGSVDVSTGAFSYLSGNAPPSRATFGVYKGSKEFIFQRENY
jgi:MSHA biogenesis protein MshQ